MLHVLTAESTVKAARITNPNSQMPRRGSGCRECPPTGVAARAGSNARSPNTATMSATSAAKDSGSSTATPAADEPATANAPTIAAAV